MKAKYAHLLGDADVRRWFDNLAARSIVTVTVYLRTLGFYCDLNKTDPKAILKVAKTKAFRDDFTDFIRRMEREGKAGSYLSRFKKVLNSWLSYNGVNVKLKVNIRGESDTPRIADERVPNKEKLDRILRMATPRGRASIALMAFSGLRPESLGNYDGSDGLRLGDFVEAEIQPDGVKFVKVPTMLVVRKSLLGIDLVDVKVTREKQFGRELNKDEELELYERELKRLREGSHNPQRIAHEKELEKYLAEGWQFVSVLPSRKILVKKTLTKTSSYHFFS
jgi:hypothetical protein